MSSRQALIGQFHTYLLPGTILLEPVYSIAFGGVALRAGPSDTIIKDLSWITDAVQRVRIVVSEYTAILVLNDGVP